MKKPLAIFAGMVLLFGILFVVVNYSGTEAVDKGKQEKPVEASNLAPATYQPVGHGFAFFRPTVADFNHNGTGAQGVLLELLQNRMSPGDGSGTRYYYLLYNHRVAKNPQPYSTLICNLQDMLHDSHGNGYTQLSFMANGEGLVDEKIGLENGDTIGAYPGATCGFVILAVRSGGAIPNEAWDQAEKLWASATQQSADAKGSAESNAPQQNASGDNSPSRWATDCYSLSLGQNAADLALDKEYRHKLADGFTNILSQYGVGVSAGGENAEKMYLLAKVRWSRDTQVASTTGKVLLGQMERQANSLCKRGFSSVRFVAIDVEGGDSHLIWAKRVTREGYVDITNE